MWGWSFRGSRERDFPQRFPPPHLPSIRLRHPLTSVFAHRPHFLLETHEERFILRALSVVWNMAVSFFLDINEHFPLGKFGAEADIFLLFFFPSVSVSRRFTRQTENKLGRCECSDPDRRLRENAFMKRSISGFYGLISDALTSEAHY